MLWKMWESSERGVQEEKQLLNYAAYMTEKLVHVKHFRTLFQVLMQRASKYDENKMLSHI